MKLSDLPERYQQQALLQIGDHPPCAAAVSKRHPRDEPVCEKKAQGHHRPYGFSGPVRIKYRDSRRRLIDSDNGWTKYFTDALVSCGAIPDDDTSVIPQRPSVTQSKAKEESLVIVIEAIDERNP